MTLYTIGLFGFMLAGAVSAFLIFSIPNPNSTGRALITVSLAITVGLLVLAVGGRIALRVYYDWVFDQALAKWTADPERGATITEETLADLAGLPSDQAWLAREFLARRAKRHGKK